MSNVRGPLLDGGLTCCCDDMNDGRDSVEGFDIILGRPSVIGCKDMGGCVRGGEGAFEYEFMLFEIDGSVVFAAMA